jgi:hypothetical protein
MEKKIKNEARACFLNFKNFVYSFSKRKIKTKKSGLFLEVAIPIMLLMLSPPRKAKT